jgi:copper homeostasis protein
LETGAKEFHSSARISVENTMSFANPRVSDAGNMFVADEFELKKMVELLNRQSQP